MLCIFALGARGKMAALALLAAGAAVTAVARDQPARDPQYPAAWWAEVPREDAASWEILPQDAAPGEVILSKRTELGLFSNFAGTAFTLDGEQYPSLEGFWQAMKYPENDRDPRATSPGIQWAFTRAQVAKMIGFEAKHAGDLGSDNMKKMGIDYVTYQGKQMPYHTTERGEHYDLIVRATHAKLDQNPAVKALLVKTGNLVLKPDHNQDGDASPAWHYYAIYTEIRATLLSRTH